MNVMSSTSCYDRDATVAAIRSFYTFLTALPKLSDTDIQDAPTGGWPDLTAEYLAPLNKNDTVVDLFRHLPYIADSCEGSQISFETSAINYSGGTVRWDLGRKIIEGTLSPIGAGRIPEHVAVLTSGARYGSWLLLDTEAGTVTDFIQQERPERSEPDQDSPDHWRAYKTLPVEEFFEEWKENYRSLQWVPIPGNYDDGVLLQLDSRTDEVQDIYRAHGWPDDFQRDACREAVMKWDRRT